MKINDPELKNLENTIILAAKEISDRLQLDILETLKLKSLEKKDENGLYQGQICHLIAAFSLSLSLKILEINKIPQHLVDALCEQCIGMAKDFAAMGKFHIHKDH